MSSSSSQSPWPSGSKDPHTNEATDPSESSAQCLKQDICDPLAATSGCCFPDQGQCISPSTDPVSSTSQFSDADNGSSQYFLSATAPEFFPASPYGQLPMSPGWRSADEGGGVLLPPIQEEITTSHKDHTDVKAHENETSGQSELAFNSCHPETSETQSIPVAPSQPLLSTHGDESQSFGPQSEHIMNDDIVQQLPSSPDALVSTDHFSYTHGRSPSSPPVHGDMYEKDNMSPGAMRVKSKTKAPHGSMLNMAQGSEFDERWLSDPRIMWNNSAGPSNYSMASPKGQASDNCNLPIAKHILEIERHLQALSVPGQEAEADHFDISTLPPITEQGGSKHGYQQANNTLDYRTELEDQSHQMPPSPAGKGKGKKVVRNLPSSSHSPVLEPQSMLPLSQASNPAFHGYYSGASTNTQDHLHQMPLSPPGKGKGKEVVRNSPSSSYSPVMEPLPMLPLSELLNNRDTERETRVLDQVRPAEFEVNDTSQGNYFQGPTKMAGNDSSTYIHQGNSQWTGKLTSDVNLNTTPWSSQHTTTVYEKPVNLPVQDVQGHKWSSSLNSFFQGKPFTSSSSSFTPNQPQQVIGQGSSYSPWGQAIPSRMAAGPTNFGQYHPGPVQSAMPWVDQRRIPQSFTHNKVRDYNHWRSGTANMQAQNEYVGYHQQGQSAAMVNDPSVMGWTGAEQRQEWTPPRYYGPIRGSIMPPSRYIPINNISNVTPSRPNTRYHGHRASAPTPFGRLPAVQDRRRVPGGRILNYRPNTDTMFKGPGLAPWRSDKLQELMDAIALNPEAAKSNEHLPFVVSTEGMEPATWGVVKLGSVPYNVTQKDILNFLCKDFLGRDAKIVTPEYGPAVHVMMDRTSGKTLDVYVEFLSHRDAVVFTQKLAIAREKEHRKLMIGERHITWEISSQEALMRDLFPRAKNVVWEGQMPKIIADTTPYNTGFKCFITNEELLSMAKQAEQPNKSGFIRSPTRPYENMISILYKFPWFATPLYTHSQILQISNTTRSMLSTLHIAVQRGIDPGLTTSLLHDLLFAGLNCPALTEQDKYHIYNTVQSAHSLITISPLSRLWPWISLSRKPGAEEDVIAYYAQLHASVYSEVRLSGPSANVSGNLYHRPIQPPLPFQGGKVTVGPWLSPNMTMETIVQNEKWLLGNMVEQGIGMGLVSGAGVGMGTSGVGVGSGAGMGFGSGIQGGEFPSVASLAPVASRVLQSLQGGEYPPLARLALVASCVLQIEAQMGGGSMQDGRGLASLGLASVDELPPITRVAPIGDGMGLEGLMEGMSFESAGEGGKGGSAGGIGVGTAEEESGEETPRPLYSVLTSHD